MWIAQYNKFIMIDRIFFAADDQTPNPYGHMATEYDVTTDTFRDLSSGITSNSWCSAVRLLLMSGIQPCCCALGASSGPHASVPDPLHQPGFTRFLACTLKFATQHSALTQNILRAVRRALKLIICCPASRTLTLIFFWVALPATACQMCYLLTICLRVK